MACATIMLHVVPYIYIYTYIHIYGASSNLYTPDSVSLSSLARMPHIPPYVYNRLVMCSVITAMV